jgi:hypothetical protein
MTVTLDKNGNATLNMEKIEKISIDHITDIISHRIMRTDDLTVHEMEFIREGKCYLSYTAQGKIVACKIDNMTMEVNFENSTLILKPCKLA